MHGKTGTIVMDERLERLGDRFVNEQIGRMLGITFEQYVSNPGYYDELVDALDAGCGLNILKNGDAVIIELGMARAA